MKGNKAATNKSTKKNTKTMNSSLTLAGALEIILNAYNEPPICIDDEMVEFYDNSDEAMKLVQSTLDVSNMQAVLLAAIVELSIADEASPGNIARKLGSTNLHFIELQNDIDVLVEKRYVRTCTHKYRGLSYHVPDEVIKCIKNGERPDGADVRGLSSSMMLRRMNHFFREFWRDNIDIATLRNELADLIKFNPQNEFVKQWEAAGIDGFASFEKILLLYMCVRNLQFSEDTFGWEDFGKLFEEDMDEDMVHISMNNGTLDLMKAGYVDYANNEGIVDNSHIVITDKLTFAFLSEVKTNTVPVHSTCRNIISSRTIREKSLFFNDAENRQVNTLIELLSQEKYLGVVERLKENGMRSGVCICLYGPAGTGKTETAYQVARKTGRDIYMVDVSQLKSKWVGDSEKNVRALFQEYRSLVRNCEKAPILLFNEADAIFGVRKKGAEESVDKMNNAIQNIILQEMENIEGIMIATTNLFSTNFDPAFERRFLYKIGFSKPCVEAKTHIWETMISGLNDKDARTLAGEYDFSGGQIENVSRKVAIDYILSGSRRDLDGIRELCDEESTSDMKLAERNRIGF